MPDSPINRPGAPTNTLQHLFDNGTGINEGRPDNHTAKEGAHRQTGENTSPDPSTEVQDPHASNEEHPYGQKHPGGSHPPKIDIGPNPAAHDEAAPRRPHNAGSGPE